MSAATFLVLTVGATISYVNGANDVSKGIATLVGSGIADYRKAILWGAAWTGAGGLAASKFANAMVAAFGTGLLAPGTQANFLAAVATILGAAAWVLFATQTGLPVSTTHAIIGSLAGVAAVAYGVSGVHWMAIGDKILLPLLLSPIVSLAATILLMRLLRVSLGRSAATDCVCVSLEPVLVAIAGTEAAVCSGTTIPVDATVRVATGSKEACAREYPSSIRLSINHLHWLTAGATSLARGMNDIPKIVALMLAASALAAAKADSLAFTFAVATLGMVAGSVVAGVRVTRVLAERVTPMDHREGFVSNLVTSALVAAGALGGLPMSTTHVSGATIIGVGMQKGAGVLNSKTVREMILAWVLTVPCAAALGVVVFLAAKAVLK